MTSVFKQWGFIAAFQKVQEFLEDSIPLGKQREGGAGECATNTFDHHLMAYLFIAQSSVHIEGKGEPSLNHHFWGFGRIAEGKYESA